MALAQLKYILQWYCDRTSLHGFNHITNRNSSVSSKWFFMIASLCSLILCAYLILLQMGADNYHIMSTVTSTSYPVWKVRFPSVTVCNFNRVFNKHTEKILNIVKQRGIQEEHFNNFVHDLSDLTIYGDLREGSGHYDNIFTVLNGSGYTTDVLMSELAQPCSSMLKKCLWQSYEWPCLKLFKFVKTSHGYCCSFNYFGTRNELKNIEYARHKHAKGAGPAFGLRVTLDVAKDQYTSSIKPAYGFNVLVQDGLHYPDMEVSSNTILASEELTLSVTPKLFSYSEDIEIYEVNERCCFFDYEGSLNWMSNYSHKTCISECKTNAIVELCGCIPYYYPITNHTRICTLLDVQCLRENIYNYNALTIKSCYTNANTVERFHKKLLDFNITACACYPQCSEMMYDIQSDKTKLVVNANASNLSILNVYYISNGCIKNDKNVYSTWYRILGVIGGIFGLCSGGSVISILESFYFIFVRITTGSSPAANPRFYANDFSHHQRVMQNPKKLEKGANLKILNNNYVK